jgi:hypothetical protein
MRRLAAVLICALVLLGCTVKRRRDSGWLDRGPGDFLGDRPAPSDALLERVASDATRERRATDARALDASLFSCKLGLGVTSLQGAPLGKPLGATHALAASVKSPLQPPFAVLFSSQGTSCASVRAQHLVLTIGLCQASAGSYAIGETCSNGSKLYARLAKGLALDEGAQAGTVIVETLDASCGGKSRGSFVLSFRDQGGPALVTGAFDTIGCGALSSL